MDCPIRPKVPWVDGDTAYFYLSELSGIEPDESYGFGLSRSPEMGGERVGLQWSDLLVRRWPWVPACAGMTGLGEGLPMAMALEEIFFFDCVERPLPMCALPLR